MSEQLEQAVIDFDAKPTRMCSACKTVPVPSKSAWYCSPCRAEIRRRKIAATLPCARCKVNDRHIRLSGKVSSYCSECENQIHTKYATNARVNYALKCMEAENPGEQEVKLNLPARYVFAPKVEPVVQHRNWRIQPVKRNVFGEPIQDFGAGVSVSFLSPEQVAEAKANGRRVLESAVQAR
jgi:hypothetical protein